MTYTTHGHYIPNTINTVKAPENKEDCGGVKKCVVCIIEATDISAEMKVEPLKTENQKLIDAHTKARSLVADWIGNHTGHGQSTGDTPTHLVWFAKILQHWKAVVVSPSMPGTYFEVTYNGDKKTSYIDVYYKSTNDEVKD